MQLNRRPTFSSYWYKNWPGETILTVMEVGCWSWEIFILVFVQLKITVTLHCWSQTVQTMAEQSRRKRLSSNIVISLLLNWFLWPFLSGLTQVKMIMIADIIILKNNLSLFIVWQSSLLVTCLIVYKYAGKQACRERASKEFCQHGSNMNGSKYKGRR